MNGKNENKISLLDMMEDILKELNRTEDLKGKNPGEIMRLYNTTLYSSEVPEHLRSHREDIDDIFTDKFASSLESKIKEYTGDNKIDIGLLDKIKQVESDFQNSYLLESYLYSTVKSKYNYTDEDMGNLFGSISNKEKVLNYLFTKDLNEESISAIMGNIDVETGGSYDYQQKQVGVEDGAYGLFQFEPNVHFDNYQKNLKENTKEDSYKSQIDYAYDSIYGNEREFLGYGDAKDIREAFNSKNVNQSTVSIIEDFLKPGKPHKDRRLKSADKVMEDFFLPSLNNTNQGKEEIDNLLDMYYNPTNVRVKEALKDLKPISSLIADMENFKNLIDLNGGNE